MSKIKVITLDRPEKRNALSVELMERLLVELKAEAEVLIIRGEGPVFCSGLDLSELDVILMGPLIGDLLKAIYQFPGVTICAMQGAAIAGGAAILSACDLVVAEESAKIGFPEARLGIVAGYVAALLSRQLRRRDINELLLLGDLITAKRAQEMGLVSHLVKTNPFEEAQKIAEQVLKGAPETLLQSKKLIQELDTSFDNDWKTALDYHHKSRKSAEAMEGARAFMEKREPNWI